MKKSKQFFIKKVSAAIEIKQTAKILLQKIKLPFRKRLKNIRKNFGQIHQKMQRDQHKIITSQTHDQLFATLNKPPLQRIRLHCHLLVKLYPLVTILRCSNKIIHIDFKLIRLINIFIINLLRLSQKIYVQLQSKDKGYGNKYKQVELLDSRSQTIFKGKREKNGIILISSDGRNFIA